jgi:serine/threonine-protein phosphatase 2B catalytic subunit
MLEIVYSGANVFRKEQNMLEVSEPVVVVGDIHGQFYDLLRLLEIGGSPGTTSYLFLGDFVDRGSFSVECIMLLYALKLNFPHSIYMIRGNHECRQLTSFFNFRAEVLSKYDEESYDAIMDSFDCLPLAALISKKFLALHGGISPELQSIRDLQAFSRFTEPPRQGLMCDLLWADPVDQVDGKSREMFKLNQTRGCSFFYNVEAVNRFLRRNDLISIIRAHEAQQDGYKMYRWNGNSEFPCVITIFSAPNYCGVYKNKGAIIRLENSTLNIQQYNYTPHPYLLPDFLDIFSWSLPFLIEKVLHMWNFVLRKERGEALPVGDQIAQERLIKLAEEAKEVKGEVLKKRLKFMSKMMVMMKNVRAERELILQMKDACPDDKLPRALLSESAFSKPGSLFKKAKLLDSVNELRPEG